MWAVVQGWGVWGVCALAPTLILTPTPTCILFPCFVLWLAVCFKVIVIIIIISSSSSSSSSSTVLALLIDYHYFLLCWGLLVLLPAYWMSRFLGRSGE